MNKYENLNELLTDIATSIRNKTKDANSIKADDLLDAIDNTINYIGKLECQMLTLPDYDT